MNVINNVTEGAERFPNKVAGIDEAGETRTYGELNEQSRRIASSLVSLGVGRGDRVAILMENSVRFVEVYLGVLRIGAISVGIQPALKPDEVRYILENSTARIVITTPLLLDHLPDTMPETLADVLMADGDPHSGLSLSTLTVQADPTLSPSKLEAGTPLTIAYSSGTTGFPKGVVLTHGNFNSFVHTHAQISPIQETDRLFFYYHLSGAYAQELLHTVFSCGATAVIFTRIQPQKIVEVIATHKVTVVFAAPAAYAMLYDQASVEQMATVQLFVFGGSPLPIHLLHRWHEKYGCWLNNDYGLTEILSATRNRNMDIKPTSIGLPLSSVEARIVDPDDNEVEQGQYGEMVFRGPTVMQGYWNQPEATAQTLRNGWFHSGDVGYVDEDGYFYVVDRIKQMIDVGGMKVYPSEVERVLMQHPAIVDATVYGVPGGLLGERVWASVVVKSGHTVEEDELRDYCSHHLAGYKIPLGIDILEKLPRNPNGKVLRRELQEAAIRRLESQAADIGVMAGGNYGTQIRDYLRKQTAAILAVDESQIELDDHLLDLGVDSVSAIDLNSRIRRFLGVDVPITYFFEQGISLEALAQHIEVGTSQNTAAAILNPPVEPEMIEGSI